MTEKSDAQLDAEAAGRRVHLEESIDLHRHLYRADCEVNRLVSRQPPLTRYSREDWTEEPPARYGADNEYVIEPGARTGMPMSGSLIRRLTDPPGGEYPWLTALAAVRRQCRRLHRYHTAPKHWRGSLCWSMVYMVIVGKPLGGGPATIAEAAGILQYDDPEPVLRQAFDHIETVMDDYRARAEARERELSGQFSVTDRPAPEHHSVPGLHMQDCPRCKKESAA